MAELPSGTVTFLFTDIEGSTARWEQDPEAMRAALDRHDALVRQAVTGRRGYIFKTVGDAVYAAFGTAPEALAAALAAQRALHAEPWGGPEPLRVRMALHTGAADERGGDYVGPSLSRVARLLAAGHGGQILLSQPTYDLVRDELPAGASVRDLGERRLKDLIRPERVFQVVAAGLPAAFPPLRTLDAGRHNLPVQATPLLGREREVTRARQRLLDPDVSLLTLTGPGGTGKTRLGLQIAAEVIDHFEDGVFFVALATISDPGLVVSAIADTLGVRDAGGRPRLDSLKDYLRTRQMLLVLDNFEQVLGAAALVADVLAASPRLKVLVTSRAALHLRGEHEFPVPPLALPDREHPPSIGAVSQYAAVALFIERAAAVKPDFAVTNANAPIVAEICHRLDGLPLAIELAAARIRLLSPSAMLARLARRLPLLTGGARDLPVRQQTLRGAIQWSYDLLDSEEQRLFGRLAVFVGGCTLDAAEAVCRPPGVERGVDDRAAGSCARPIASSATLAIDILDGVASLVDKSLLRQDEQGEGEPRFTMLETIREYALERLEAGGEAESVRRRHAEYYLALAEEASPRILGPDQVTWLDRLEAEQDNLRAALAWSQSEAGNPEAALRLATAQYRFWHVRGYLSEGRDWLTRVLTRDAGGAQDAARVRQLRAAALNGAAVLARAQGSYAAARALFEESLAILRASGDRWGIANALHNLGSVALYQGDYDRATALLEESLARWRKLGDRWGTATALHFLGQAAHYAGDHQRAGAVSEESLALFRSIGDLRGIAMVLHNLGRVAYARGDDERAAMLYGECLALYRDLRDSWSIALTLSGRADVAHRQGDHDRAAVLYRESLALRRQQGDQRGAAECLEGLGGVAAAQDRPTRAAQLFGAAEALRAAIGAPLPPRDRALQERDLAAVRARLGEAAFAAAWAEGRAMPPEQTVADALEAAEPGRGPETRS